MTQFEALEQQQSPWYIVALVGLGAWLAALFLLIASITLFVDHGELSSLIAFKMAVIWALLSLLLTRLFQSNLFVEQFSIAAALVAQGCFVVAVVQLNESDKFMRSLTILLSHAVAIFVVKRRLLIFTLTGVAASALYWLLYEFKLVYLSTTLMLAIWLYLVVKVEHWMSLGWLKRVMPVIFALTLSILYAYVYVLDRAKYLTQLEPVDSPMLAGLATGALAIIAAKLMVIDRLNLSGKQVWSVYGAIVLIAAVGAEISGFTTAMLFLLVGFALSHRVLMGLAIVSLLSFVTFYYYSLQATLLEKSQYLLAFGIVLLGVRYLLNRINSQGVSEHE